MSDNKVFFKNDHHFPFLHYLTELRQRLLYTLIVLLALFAVLCFFANDFYQWLALPALKNLPQHGTLIATSLTTTFITPLKLVAFLTVFLGFPVILYHLWSFVAPALYHHERRLTWLLLLFSSLLFYLGVAFGYGVIFPIMVHFFVTTAPTGVTVMPEMEVYLETACKMVLLFGALFEVPLLIVALVWTGAVKLETLQEKRPYVVVGAFILGMLLASPDVISQTLFAVPMWILFELGIVIAKLVKK